MTLSLNPSATRIAAIVRKEFRHLRRDPRMVIAVLFVPILQLLLFAYAISFDVHNVATVLIDGDHTSASRSYLDTYRASRFFDIRKTDVSRSSDQHGSAAARAPQGVADVDRIFQTGQAQIVVVVPAGFAEQQARQEKAQVGVFIDGSEANSARIASGYVTALNAVSGQQVTLAWADRSGLDPGAAGQFQPRVRTWYNPDRSSSIFLIPGLIVVIIMIVTVQQTAVTLVRERDQGTEEQLRVSPLRRWELMVGKLLPWTILAFVDVVVITLVGMTVFAVPFRGSVPAFALASAIFVFAALALGLIVSAVANSIEVANIVALMMAFLPAFLLSGFAFPLASIPTALQWLSYVFPARYMVDVSRAVFLKGADFGQVWLPMTQLAGYAIVALLLASVLSRRRST